MGAGVTGTERREVGPWCQMQGVKHRQETVHAATTAKSLQSCPTLCDRIDGSPPGSLSLGFSRQEHWSGLPFPSPVHESEKWKWSRSVVSDCSRPHGLQPTRLLCPWDFPGKSTGVGATAFSESVHGVVDLMRAVSVVPGECLHVASVVCNPMACRPPDSSAYGILQARVMRRVAMLSSRGSSQCRDRTLISFVSCIGRQGLYH